MSETNPGGGTQNPSGPEGTTPSPGPPVSDPIQDRPDPSDPTVDPAEDDPEREGEDRFDAG